MTKNKLFIIPALILLVSCSNEPKTTFMSPVENPFNAQFMLPDTQGNLVDMSAFYGKYVLVNFWATWCKPCVKELPSLDRLEKKVNNMNKFSVIGVHVGQNPDIVNKFLKKNKVSFTNVIDEDITLSNWMVEAIPTTFLVNQEGIAIYYALGKREWDDAEFIKFINSIIESEK